jgi:hypothetical protein
MAVDECFTIAEINVPARIKISTYSMEKIKSIITLIQSETCNFISGDRTMNKDESRKQKTSIGKRLINTPVIFPIKNEILLL